MIDHKRVLHCAKRLIKIEKLFNDEVDELLEALHITREEVENSDKVKKK